MIIADSGSTKTDWRVISKDRGLITKSGKGVNPFLWVQEDINAEFAKSLQGTDSGIEEIYFYGAGCSNEANKNKIRTALALLFPDALITIEHDMLAAARALCQHDKGLVGILGTGSNACSYDGTKIDIQQPSLGYLLGDEGSGNHIGRTLIKSWLYGKMPEDLQAELEKSYEMDKNTFLKELYALPRPNTYLASFARFVGDHSDLPFMIGIIRECLGEFLDQHIVPLVDGRAVPCHFIGSVARHFSDQLRYVAEERGLVLGQIAASPMPGLLKFHGINSEE